jgi:hypothetical protein
MSLLSGDCSGSGTTLAFRTGISQLASGAFLHRLATFAAQVGILLSVASTCFAADSTQQVSLYGIAIGAPLPVPKCEAPGYSLEKSMCFRTLADPGRIPGTRVLTVFFAQGERPAILKNDYFIVTLLGDSVESIAMVTRGPAVQVDAIKQLTGKFGSASNTETKTAQNAFGAKIDYLDAIWLLGSATLSFQGLSRKIDEGSISADSERFVQAFKQWRASPSSTTGPKL